MKNHGRNRLARLLREKKCEELPPVSAIWFIVHTYFWYESVKVYVDTVTECAHFMVSGRGVHTCPTLYALCRLSSHFFPPATDFNQRFGCLSYGETTPSVVWENASNR